MAARLAVDIGGTFTDIVLETGGRHYATKVLTTSKAPEQGVIAGVRTVLDRAEGDPTQIALMIHGTTLATNAIIERKGARTALISTQGFRDVLEIADEGRYDQYDIFLQKPKPLVPRERRFTVPERVNVAGEVILALDEAAVSALVPELEASEVQSVAIGFLHSYRNGAHEQRVREILQAAMPELSFCLASEVCPEIREYERLSTACANAYVQPLMGSYLGRLGEELGHLGLRCPLLLMTSGGGLTTLDTARRFPIRLVESGPAGGAILASSIAQRSRLDKVLSFDMGGTTAKICLIEDGQAQTSRSFEVDRAARFIKGSGLPLRIPVIEMVEIGAGGGSIARVDGLKQIAIGPDSAGSDPGPACYGRDGDQPTVTDADLILGRIDPENFAGGTIELEPERARRALAASVGSKLDLTAEMAAYGIGEIVDETMANAARVHAVERGRVVSEHTLIAFGGAAPLHAARLAEKLSIDRVLVPANAGVGSAVGLLRAPIAYEVVRSRYLRLQDFDTQLVNELFESLREEAWAVVSTAAPSGEIEESRLVYMRYVGQGHEIAVSVPARPFTHEDANLFRAAFDQSYEAQYARTIPGAEVEILTWALTLSAPSPGGADELMEEGAPQPAPAATRCQIFDAARGAYTELSLYLRSALTRSTRLAGPCIIAETDTSTFVSESFEATLDERGAIVLERCQ